MTAHPVPAVRTVAEIIAAHRHDSVAPTAGVTSGHAPAGSATSGTSGITSPGASTSAAGSTARRHRGGNAASVIATLTAELAATHPGLLEGSPHQRRAAGPAAEATTPARRAASHRHVAPAGREFPAALRPDRAARGLYGALTRVSGGMTGGAAGSVTGGTGGGWKLPARTPLLLAGVVAVSVVITDQTGVLSSSAGTIQATAAADTRAAGNAATTAQTARDRQDRARVSRLQRQEVRPDSTGAAAPAGSGTLLAAPPADSVMKPGQTVPGNWVRPSPNGVYNSCFCSRWGTMHEGIDFAAPLGSPILAVGDGVVVQAGPASGFGNWVIIKHANGDMTIYGHMKYYYVKVGDHVTAGQEIALVGQEGESTGPHLHLGVKINSTNGHDGTYVDPVPWLVARGVAVGTYNQNG